MMILWSGKGFLVAVIVFGWSLVFNVAFEAFVAPRYYDTHKWPLAISLALSGVTCWVLGSWLRKRAPQTVIDKATGKELVLDRGRHSLFFIPMHFWGPLLGAIACIVAVVDLTKK